MFPRTALTAAVAYALAAVLTGPAVAATLTGVMVYSADVRGMPVGLSPQSATIDRGQLWHTWPSARWYGLGVLRGLPPESLATPLLNTSDFGLNIPLEDGDHDFTLVGEPGPLTEDDAYDLWALNLFVGGVAERPAISVLFPPNAYRYGVPVRPNGAEVTIALPVVAVSGVHADSYDDGTTRITVHAASFLPPHRFIDVDLVSSTVAAPGGDGRSDWVGVLRITVETKEADPGSGGGAGGVPRAIGPAAFGVVPLEGAVVGSASGEDLEAAEALRDRPSGWRSAAVKTPTADTTETAAMDEGTPTPEAGQTAATTTTPGTPTTPTAPAGSPTPPVRSPTPQGVHAPTGSVTVSPSAEGTPSPALGPSDANGSRRR